MYIFKPFTIKFRSKKYNFALKTSVLHNSCFRLFYLTTLVFRLFYIAFFVFPLCKFKNSWLTGYSSPDLWPLVAKAWLLSLSNFWKKYSFFKKSPLKWIRWELPYVSKWADNNNISNISNMGSNNHHALIHDENRPWLMRVYSGAELLLQELNYLFD